MALTKRFSENTLWNYTTESHTLKQLHYASSDPVCVSSINTWQESALLKKMPAVAEVNQSQSTIFCLHAHYG